MEKNKKHVRNIKHSLFEKYFTVLRPPIPLLKQSTTTVIGSCDKPENSITSM